MSGKRYTEEFKIGAVNQVVEQGHSVFSVASRLGCSGNMEEDCELGHAERENTVTTRNNLKNIIIPSCSII